MSTDQIRLVSVDKLKAHPKNARTHSKNAEPPSTSGAIPHFFGAV